MGKLEALWYHNGCCLDRISAVSAAFTRTSLFYISTFINPVHMFSSGGQHFLNVREHMLQNAVTHRCLMVLPFHIRMRRKTPPDSPPNDIVYGKYCLVHCHLCGHQSFGGGPTFIASKGHSSMFVQLIAGKELLRAVCSEHPDVISILPTSCFIKGLVLRRI